MSILKREILPVVPLRRVVAFPGVLLSLEMTGETGARLAAEIAAGRAPRVLLVPQASENEVVNGAIGVEVEVKHSSRPKRGAPIILVQGLARRRLVAPLQIDPFLTAEVEAVEEPVSEGAELNALVRAVRDGALQLMQQNDAPDAAVREIEGLDSPSALADRAAAHCGLSFDESVAVLGELDVTARLARVRDAIALRLAAAAQAEAAVDPNLRQKVLREKLAEIQRELGEKPDAGDEWSEKIAAADLPPEVAAAARREARKLRGGDGGSPDQTVARTYLEWLLELPWSKRSESAIDLDAARRILDEDHDGLTKVKQRIVEYLAVRKLNPAKKGPILLLVGPPGVGKTSLGRSIARALGRAYVRVSLGGVRDEAEIRGHRRTYIGALPGRIIQGLRRAGTRNPVFVLDEIDKLGADHRGDPSSALLEVLDPEQNGTFSDHYLEVPFDLSEVVFLATANELGPIPAPLRDRMEILQLAGYTTAEKRAIAGAHLVPRQRAEHGLADDQLRIAPDALVGIIEGYTREPGVRNLEREIARVARDVAVKVAAGDAFDPDVKVEDLATVLGPQRFFSEVADRDPRPGVATGLVVTPSGGEIAFIETTLMPGKGKLVVTGQLGDVMQESAQAAMSFVRSHAAELGILPTIFERHDVHIHVPAGAQPKDGPSAGQAMATALVSLFTGRPVRGDVAITGEVTLRGHVLPVGGIAAKVLAAHRAGITRVILPARNAKDLADLPAEIRAEIDIRLVSRLAETLSLALAEETAAPPLAANANQSLPAVAQIAA